MKTKEMPIVEVSKKFKEELDQLDVICEANDFYERTGLTKIDKELNDILEKYDEFTYKSQVIMYLASTKNYTLKPEPIFYVMYGLNCSSYYVTEINPTIDKNVYVAEYNNEKDAKKHVEKLNKLLEDNK